MKSSTNLINGSYAQTLGYYSKNDGGKALYKIREITNDDIVDEKFIITINNNLIAELIIKDNILNIKQIGGSNTNDNTEILQYAINNALSKKYIIYIPNGSYLLNNTITIDNDIKIHLEKNANLYTNSDIDLMIINELYDLFMQIL